MWTLVDFSAERYDPRSIIENSPRHMTFPIKILWHMNANGPIKYTLPLFLLTFSFLNTENGPVDRLAAGKASSPRIARRAAPRVDGQSTRRVRGRVDHAGHEDLQPQTASHVRHQHDQQSRRYVFDFNELLMWPFDAESITPHNRKPSVQFTSNIHKQLTTDRVIIVCKKCQHATN